jgi:hypothetical protein
MQQLTQQLPVKQWTTKQIVANEYKHCAEDPKYFFKKYCVIQHPKRGKIPFVLYPFQRDCIDYFLEHRYNIVLKSRQLGLSTLSAAYALWLMTFKSDQNILVIATKKEVAKNIITKVRVMYDKLPSWLRNLSVEDNKMSLAFSNGSQIKAISSSPTAGRSEALSLLILDEAAFIRDIVDIWGAAQQTLATGGDCIILSTPNGMGNWFYDMWSNAEEGVNGFNTTALKWDVHPERDQRWRDEQDVKLGERLASQECDADFLASGNNVVNLMTLKFFEETFVREPEEKRSIDKGLWIWEYPDYTHNYLICADVARGDGSDYSAFQVFDVDSLVQVAEYKGLADTREYGRLLAAVGIEYNNALVVVERENVGWDTIQELIDINYQNLFYSSNDLQYVDSLRNINNKKNRELKKMKPGFATTRRNRPLLIAKIERYFEDNNNKEDNAFKIYSQRLINELKVFIWNHGKAEAQSGKNDDLVISLGILLWVRDTAMRLRNEGIELTKMALDRIGKAEFDIGLYKPGVITHDPTKMDIGKEVVDLNEYL